MTRAMFTAAVYVWAALALAQENATENEAATAAPPKTAAETATTAEAKVKPAFKLPPGFYEKKHGKYTLYCKKDAPMGTRIRSERCMNDAQMRDYLIALEEQKANLDRIRATCATATACGSQ